MNAFIADMRGRFASLRHGERHRIVLVLDADGLDVQAHWLSLRAGLVIDSCSGTPLDGCPWAWVRDAEPVTVVVRDAALDIERLASHGFGPTPLGAWQRHRLARTRRRERTPGRLAWLGRHATDDARAAIQRETLDAHWIERLTPLTDDGLIVARILLPERLVASSYPRRDGARFVALLEARHVRHVLVIDGVACFSRRVRWSPDSRAAASDIVASLAHALDRWSLTRVVLDVCDLPSAVSSELDSLVGAVPALVERCSACAPHAPGEATARLAARRSTGASTVGTLRPLSAAWRVRSVRRRLGLLCLAGGVAASGLAMHAGTVGANSVAAARTLDAHREQLSAQQRATLAEASALHAEPERAARFLGEFERLGESPDHSPEALLVAIAQTITRHEALTLDGIAWSHRSLDARFEFGDGVEQAVFTDVSNLPLAHLGDPVGVSVELDGRVPGALSLRKAQARVNAFADALRALDGIGRCRVMSSPLSGAARSESGPPVPATSDSNGSRAVPLWRVQCASGSRSS